MINKEEQLIARWAQHCNINYHQACADIYAMKLQMGDDLTTEYCELKMAGDTVTSLKQFSVNHGLPIQWDLLL